jgi:hypothetical protein
MTDDWKIPFMPAEFISIRPDGGNIGRFFWGNQMTFSMEQWGNDGFYEASVSELSGTCAFLWTEFDYGAWLMGGFDYPR